MLDGWLVSTVGAWGLPIVGSMCDWCVDATHHPSLGCMLLEEVWKGAAHDHGCAAEHFLTWLVVLAGLLISIFII